jgi:hypothetical protein
MDVVAELTAAPAQRVNQHTVIPLLATPDLAIQHLIAQTLAVIATTHKPFIGLVCQVQSMPTTPLDNNQTISSLAAHAMPIYVVPARELLLVVIMLTEPIYSITRHLVLLKLEFVHS